MHLFIDTNIYLSFFHYSKDDLEELRKLVVLVRANKVVLYLPEQVQDEFYRNRDAKIADALKRFNENEKLTANYPQICKQYEEYAELQRLIRDYQVKRNTLLEKIKKDIKQEQFKADAVIKELFSVAHNIKVSDDILNRAKRRYELGNPPGKKGSLGDAINWECLLETVPKMTVLYFIANDGDYFSETNDEDFSHFLVKEWSKNNMWRQILLYRRLTDFIRERFPEIKLADDYERDILTKDLLTSPTFATTRSMLRRLSRYSDLTSTQLNDVVAAAVTNDQVYWIIQDNDINQYIRQLINGRENQIEETNLKKLLALLNPTPKPEDDLTSLHEFNGGDS